jgi:hypothetical protein
LFYSKAQKKNARNVGLRPISRSLWKSATQFQDHINMKHYYHCPRCTFKDWVSGESPVCRDCGVPLERREIVSADLERGEFGLVKWASKI